MKKLYGQIVRLTALCLVALSIAGLPQARRQNPGVPSLTPVPQNANQSPMPRLTPQLGHSSMVTCAAWSPDGRVVATGSHDTTARLWDAATGTEIRSFRHPNWVESVTFLLGGKRLFTTTSSLLKTEGKKAYLWNTETGELERQIEIGKVQSVAVSRDERYILTGGETVRLFDAQTSAWVSLENVQDVTFVQFSDDGSLFLTCGTDRTVRVWQTANHQEIQRFDHPDITRDSGTGIKSDNHVNAAAFSPDNRFVVTGCNAEKTVRVWQRDTSTEVQEFAAGADYVSGVAFSHDGRRVIAISSTLQAWERDSGRMAWECKSVSVPRSLSMSPDGDMLLLAEGYEKTAALVNAETGALVRRFEGQVAPMRAVAVSSDNHYIATSANDAFIHAKDTRVRLWETEIGGETRLLDGSDSAQGIAFSPDSKLVATCGMNGLQVYETATGRRLKQFPDNARSNSPNNSASLKDAVQAQMQNPGWLTSLAFSPDGRYLVTGGMDGVARKWEIATGREVLSTRKGYQINSVAVSHDGRAILTGGGSVSLYSKFVSFSAARTVENTTLILWNAETGAVERLFPDSFPVASVAFSPDDKTILGTVSSGVFLYDRETGSSIGLTDSKSISGTPAVFSPDGTKVLTGSADFWQELVAVDFYARIYSLSTRELKQYFGGHSYSVNGVAFTADGKIALTASADGTTALWDANTGVEICRLLSLRDGNWVVVAPDGRFDASDLEGIRGLYWIMPDDPLRPLPLEIFMRDYYQPQLLQRLLDPRYRGEVVKPERNIAELNRVQPQVSIKEIKQHKDAPDLVDVTVEIAGGAGWFQIGGKRQLMTTGVYDLRLFRDRQMVGYSPKPADELPARSNEGLAEWRERTAIKFNDSGSATVTFPNIRLPHRTGERHFEFSAYAFNRDRVKSATARRNFDLAQPLAPIKARAYIISIGVNAYQSEVWNLNFAASDARRLSKSLAERLQNSGEYDVVPVRLLSDARATDGRILEKTATRANIEAVFRKLAGKPVAGDVLKGVENADKLDALRPDDLLVVSLSCHGVTDDAGNFYVLPFDIGAAQELKVTPALLKKAISSLELAEWLRDVDSGEMVLIVDACHSAAAVEAQGFKPAPMGSRGLGQLAFDKQMRVLAATQATETAPEERALGSSRLVRALLADGLEAGLADADGDGKITLREWLAYGRTRVPELVAPHSAQGWKAAQTSKVAAGKGASAAKAMEEIYQKPALFDFDKRKRDILLK